MTTRYHDLVRSLRMTISHRGTASESRFHERLRATYSHHDDLVLELE